MMKLFKQSLLSASLSFALATTVYSAETHNSMTPNTMTIVGSRLNFDVSQYPASVTILNKQDIEQSPTNNLLDLIAMQAGIQKSELTNNHNSGSLDIRGFGETAGQNTLILLNGQRLNDLDLAAVNLSSIPLTQVQRIEIIRGGGSVLYGSGSSAGVINIITQTRNVANQNILSGHVGSFAEKQLGFVNSAANNQHSYTLAGFKNESDGYRDNSESELEHWMFNWDEDFKDGNFYIRVNQSIREQNLPGPLTAEAMQADREQTFEPNNYAHEDDKNALLGYSRPLNDSQTLIVEGGYKDKVQRSWFDDYDADDFYDAQSYIKTTYQSKSFLPRLEWQHKLLGASALTRIGYDRYDTDYESERSQSFATRKQPKRTLTAEYQQTATYVHSTIVLTNGSVVAGWRKQKAELMADDLLDNNAPGSSPFDSQAEPIDQNESDNTWFVGYKHNFSLELSAYVQANKTVRVPTIDEIFQFNDQFMQEFSVLEWQTAKGKELGVEYQADNWNSKLSYYQQDLQNEIRFNPVTFQNVNLDDTERNGFELSGGYDITDDIHLTANYSKTKAEFSAGSFVNNSVPLVPKTMSNLAAFWQASDKLALSANVNYKSEMFFANDSSNDFGEKIPARTLVDLKASYQFEHTKVELIIKNATDKEYFDFGVNSTFSPGVYNAYPLAGRSFVLSFSSNKLLN